MIKPDEQFWKVFKETPGAFSCAEAMALIQIAALAPDGIFAEFGTHKGKSTLASIYGKRPTFLIISTSLKIKSSRSMAFGLFP